MPAVSLPVLLVSLVMCITRAPTAVTANRTTASKAMRRKRSMVALMCCCDTRRIHRRLSAVPDCRITAAATAELRAVIEPDRLQHGRRMITIGPMTTFARETPEEVVRAPCVTCGTEPPDR
ncbi:Secreted protein [Methylorubrum extorquens]